MTHYYKDHYDTVDTGEADIPTVCLIISLKCYSAGIMVMQRPKVTY